MLRKWTIRRGFMTVSLMALTACLPALAAPVEPAQSGRAFASATNSEQQPEVHIMRSRGMQSGGYLGVRLEDVTAENRAQLGLSKEEGALVQDVEKGSPAGEAGVLKGDVIVSYAGYPVFSAAQLSRLVGETPVGRKVEIAVLRNSKRVTVEAKIDQRPEGDEPGMMGRMPFDMDELQGMIRRGFPDRGGNGNARGLRFEGGQPRLGVSVTEMTDQLAEKYGLKGKSGVLVTSVQADSTAAKAGVKAGDVLTEIDGKSVETAQDIQAALRKAGGKQVELKVYRDRQAMTLKADVEGVPSQGTGSQGRVTL